MSTAPHAHPSTETAASVLAFWFGERPERAATSPDCARLWWSKQPAVDAEMRVRFGSLIAQAGAGALEGWDATPEGRLALILLCDQFTRNTARGTPEAFALDPLARAWCLEGLQANAFAALLPIQRLFAYMPLEHSESLDHQDRCVALMQGLRDEAGPTERETFNGFVDYAEKHREIIRRFGRFPHRNAILGRTSTPEEAAFLQTPGSSF
ncbi:MAG TPA: DUF924 family protein [Ideonella sp.]|uniref:DUF924 family protein n=1 Tax=Ideonella sp. TaxID=1929293 RepID=UPI002E32BC10|nr:DUF924 family protein [Ideonella sp.]HEX5684132.1 DUF924 family protein [Ideonella sp.]